LDIKSYLQLARPANIITAIADIFAGVAIATFSFSVKEINTIDVVLLCIATVGLYGGGIVFNDVFDLELDKIERPERILPSGKISKNNAITFGLLLLMIGISAAFFCSTNSGLIALIIAILALFYDKFGKHFYLFGPINMGLCRGGNLLLGMSILNGAIAEWWYLGILPVCFIAAITMISRGEVSGGNKNTLYFAGFLYAIVNVFQLITAYQTGNLLWALPFILIHIYLIFKPLIKAISIPIGPNIGRAVKAGVLSLIIMDAAWVAISGNILPAIIVLCLLPISVYLAKFFVVT
jgi:4-hydroxybenzoate polyprenyltransferase